ncbi:methylornithine synthase PylB [Methanococcoides burtonii]|uniref:Radical SAM family protein, pyrrolysine biosynthesis n=1 Tax=Methanococcoides burtonii (strain DSM 6242 / NBRC 107633 / OCM 468 / ACE-M) TaxID=259564 RepID=Q12UB7_METBU|nr:methylornithine synthase PylB [Methanococcoides burtonii]ABE52959.1 Radical SAM family protein, pyrrolysine biosynthesis [Methanococcoides burtonii DSM 6242]
MFEKMDQNDLEDYAEQIITGSEVSDENIRAMLQISDPDDMEKLHYVARHIRDNFFGNKVFMYSFVYFSTHCKNNCAFCYYNRENDIERYRLTLEDIKKICQVLKTEEIHMVDLTMGEDPYFHNNPERLAELVRTVKEEVGKPIMISPGVVDNETLMLLKENGANFLALYQETYDKELFGKLRVEQSFEERINSRNHAKRIGYLVEDGILTAVEPDIESTLISLRGLGTSNPDMVRVMTFLPQKGTPLEGKDVEGSEAELRMISILRLMYPNLLIPASLDLEGIDGMVHRLNSGANVVTSIISSNSALEGVVNYDREHAERDRDVKSVIYRLKTMGMEPAKQSDFEKLLGQ